MKTFFVTLVAFSLALIIGCQENLINEPAETMLKQKDNLVNSNTIKISYEIRDPLYGMSTLTGKVTYIHQVINQPMGPIGFNRVSIQINMDSELNNLGMMPLKWRIQGRSYDVISVSEEGIVLIEKSYLITNRTDVVLLVQYLVTTNGVGISGVSLAPLEK